MKMPHFMDGFLYQLIVGGQNAPRGKGPKGPGVLRAEARLAAKRKANEAIPSGERMTRQRLRQAERKTDKREWRLMRRERQLAKRQRRALRKAS